MNTKNKCLFESLLFSAVSQIETDLNVKSVLFKQIVDTIVNYDNKLFDSSVDINDKSLAEKYQSMSVLYEKCFETNFNAIQENLNENKTPEKTALPIHSSPDVSANIQNDYKLVLDYVNSHRYEVAIPLCKQTLEKCLKTNCPEDEYRLSYILGKMYYEYQKYAESEPYLHKAMEIRQQTYGPNDKICIEIKTKLSNALFEEKRYQNSELLSKQILNAIHENESDGRQELCIWELAEELQKYGTKDYRLVSINNEHNNWYQFYDKYPGISQVLRNISKIYAMNGKEIAAEIIKEMSIQLKQDLFGVNDNNNNNNNKFEPKLNYQTKQHMTRRKTFPQIITDSIGCQTDDNDLKDKAFDDKQQKPQQIFEKNYLFRKKLLNALGVNHVYNNFNKF